VINLIPRVLRLLGQRAVTRRDSGAGIFPTEILWLPVLGFVTVSSQSKKKKKNYARVSSGNHPLTKKPDLKLLPSYQAQVEV